MALVFQQDKVKPREADGTSLEKVHVEYDNDAIHLIIDQRRSFLNCPATLGKLNYSLFFPTTFWFFVYKFVYCCAKIKFNL